MYLLNGYENVDDWEFSLIEKNYWMLIIILFYDN